VLEGKRRARSKAPRARTTLHRMCPQRITWEIGVVHQARSVLGLGAMLVWIHEDFFLVANDAEDWSGKQCSRCHKWKPLDEFPRDRTLGPSQSERHCRCRQCHKEAVEERKLKKGQPGPVTS
jgi:hypothetical protein